MLYSAWEGEDVLLKEIDIVIQCMGDVLMKEIDIVIQCMGG